MTNRQRFNQMLNSRPDPELAYAILSGMAAAASAPSDNVAKLTERLNACKNPRRVYNAMLALAPLIREARTQQQREALIADLKGENEV